jgi:hypothetical protein
MLFRPNFVQIVSIWTNDGAVYFDTYVRPSQLFMRIVGVLLLAHDENSARRGEVAYNIIV